MKLILLSLLVTTSVALPDKEIFNNFVRDYSKSYLDENEYNKRFEIFIDNYKFVKQHNSRNDTKYQLGIIDYGLCYFPSPENQEVYFNFLLCFQSKKNYSMLTTIIPALVENRDQNVQKKK